ncbi:MAG: transcriptional regulator [Pseudopedobacter saltans]|uniref:Transcriptional regulator n=1 Tax=Pseudopedobacter saltans TaxID=151895 RepID=A0A2W5EVK0_9SPHI|nr:MAG: transcriptional regulator [Pseudopedobacter saltans]
MNNTRFATVIHILTLLADNKGQWLNSDWIASSININSVIVRKELALLHTKGWVESRKGKEGGSTLCIDSEELNLGDIYLFVKNSNVLGRKNTNTNPMCSIGNSINDKLENLYSETDDLVLGVLKNKTLADFVHEFH